ncbi:hypothetical protein DKX38_017722 [Salix brachista]|uniref:Choline transporter-like protein n=1 Tax=Salix brachista TaxID=2182728 RepID=A0A5N5KXD4_9ROSI|nr:hypothetical protein DKX38_017722 [Salix brachista]
MIILVICIQVAAKIIGEVQALIIFPVMPYAVLGISYMFWFGAAFYLFSSGQIVQNNCSSNCCAYDLVSKRVHEMREKSVNGVKLNISKTDLAIEKDGGGGCVIDCGALATLLVKPSFDTVHTALADQKTEETHHSQVE